jgi:hypothetical protein
VTKKPWFGQRKYLGYGWGAPQTWQGWAVLSVYLIFVGYQVFNLESQMKISPNTALSEYLAGIFLASLSLIVITWTTSGKPQWSSRNSKKN